MLLADPAGTFAVAALDWVTAATFPAAVSIFEPLDNLVGSEHLEIITVQIVIFIVTMWAVGLQLGG